VELLVRDSDPATREGDEAWFGSGHLVHLSDFPTKRLALLESLGFGWMPRHLVEKDLLDGTLVPVHLADGDGTWTFQPLLVRRADRSQGPASRRFESILLEASGGTSPSGA
jgi:DNA-binding transcriptional LysR family regulator